VGRPSMIHQTEMALQAMFVPGESRQAHKVAGDAAQHITGIETMRNYVGCGCKFAVACQRDYGVHFLRDITPPMAQEHLLQLHDRELSGGYIGKVVAALRKLDIALRLKKWKTPDAPLWLPEAGGWHSDAHPERAYTPEQAQRLLAALAVARDPRIVRVARLQCIAGLRISEACMLRGADIDVAHCQLHLSKATKGGRGRIVDVAPEQQDFLQELVERAAQHSDGYVFQGRGDRGKSLIRRVQAAVSRATKQEGIPHYSTHAFRKMFAQQRYAEASATGQTDREAREVVSHALGHNRVAVTYSYVPRR